MAKLLKLRRGTTSQHSSFTGAEGEVTVDTTKDSLVVHDGSTAGGHPIAKSSDVISTVDKIIEGDTSIEATDADVVGSGTSGIEAKIEDATIMRLGGDSTYIDRVAFGPASNEYIYCYRTGSPSKGRVHLKYGDATKLHTTDTGITVAGTVTATTFAGAATNVTVADESTDTSCNVLFTTAATGDLAPKSGTNLTFNSSSGALTATSFVGALGTAAQTAITSVGTLTGLGIDGQYIQQEETLTVSSNATTVDCSTGNYFTVQAAGNITFTFGTAPADTKSYAMVIEVDHNSGTLTWPASVKWPADAQPSLTAGKTHQFYFHTNDGGTRWRGASLVDYVD